MSTLAREQIESIRRDGVTSNLTREGLWSLCDMALRTGEAEAEAARLREEVSDLRGYVQAMAEESDQHDQHLQALKENALQSAPPASEPNDGKRTALPAYAARPLSDATQDTTRATTGERNVCVDAYTGEGDDGRNYYRNPAPAGRPEPGEHARYMGGEPLPEDAPAESSEALAAIDKAQEKLAAVSRGDERWTMSVPARPDSDPDLVISDALEKAKRALSQPVPAVPDAVRRLPYRLKELEQLSQSDADNASRCNEFWRGEANGIRRAKWMVRRTIDAAEAAAPEPSEGGTHD